MLHFRIQILDSTLTLNEVIVARFLNNSVFTLHQISAALDGVVVVAAPDFYQGVLKNEAAIQLCLQGVGSKHIRRVYFR